MLEVDSTIVSLGGGRLAVYLPAGLSRDSAFSLRQGDKVRITCEGDSLRVVRKG